MLQPSCQCNLLPRTIERLTCHQEGLPFLRLLPHRSRPTIPDHSQLPLSTRATNQKSSPQILEISRCLKSPGVIGNEMQLIIPPLTRPHFHALQSLTRQQINLHKGRHFSGPLSLRLSRKFGTDKPSGHFFPLHNRISPGFLHRDLHYRRRLQSQWLHSQRNFPLSLQLKHSVFSSLEFRIFGQPSHSDSRQQNPKPAPNHSVKNPRHDRSIGRIDSTAYSKKKFRILKQSNYAKGSATISCPTEHFPCLRGLPHPN